MFLNNINTVHKHITIEVGSGNYVILHGKKLQ